MRHLKKYRGGGHIKPPSVGIGLKRCGDSSRDK